MTKKLNISSVEALCERLESGEIEKKLGLRHPKRPCAFPPSSSHWRLWMGISLAGWH